jgi:hypothetical protein
MKSRQPDPQFWVTNISTKNVTLSDLALNIKALSTVNLLDKKHYNYTLEQLTSSKTSGSLFNKRDKILLRLSAPPVEKKEKMPILHHAYIPSRQKSLFEIKEVKYDELEVADEKALQQQMDEQYANENAELADSAEADKLRAVLFSKKG